MDGVAVGAHRGAANRTVFILDLVRFLGRKRPSADGFLKRIIRVVHFERDVAYAVAMLADMLGGSDRPA